MEDIRGYSENELSLRVFNDQVFYNMRYNINELMTALAEKFEFTAKQMRVLAQDIEEDLKERGSHLLQE